MFDRALNTPLDIFLKFSETFLKSYVSEHMKKDATAIRTKKKQSTENFLILSSITRKIFRMIPRMHVFETIF